MTLIKSYAHFRPSLNEMEELMLKAAHAFSMQVTLVRLGKSVTCLVGPRPNWHLRLKFTQSTSYRRDDFELHEIANILDDVVSEELTIAEAVAELTYDDDVTSQLSTHPVIHLAISGLISAAAFAALNEGGVEGAYISVAGAIALGVTHMSVQRHSQRLAQVVRLVPRRASRYGLYSCVFT